MPIFAQAAPRIRAIYGPEPCIPLHVELEAKARRDGLEDKYRILGCSAERESLFSALEKEGLLKGKGEAEGVFDTIVCIRVLCSVPRLRETLGGLYMLLKPGGKMLVVEHVVNPWRKKGSVAARVMQTLYMWLGWSYFLGDCCMDRDLGAELREVARKDRGWGAVELEENFGWSPLSYLSGFLVKKEV